MMATPAIVARMAASLATLNGCLGKTPNPPKVRAG
jgi:hypothetical protein